ncbi:MULTISPECIES: MarR family transcriptional regulator [Exiguobacterium]|uniref:Transcriptional regulator, MarR family n=1 Tax=Exiguobacterium sibiricum (strain DSM 17290 / CCUG 55495 / CIP 109462 / JCM 13490 / 255-15) TaxID=262543 RepID=B1YH24_EXIS2|nr:MULTISPECIES: MarR family transcriptional regulator [Exiguobacterium]ACB61085.1 transcriptional regulator, MarR family [Exiguobacterium sibiricum 255-15]MCT4790978.1 MarR family transcriptional regulator [Exiguobacterium artemiae]
MATTLEVANRDQLIVDTEKGLRMNYRAIKKDVRSMFTTYLTRNEFFILKSLCTSSPQIASALSNEFQFSASMITALADELTKKGLISRERSELDRRVVELRATKDGIELYGKLEAMKMEYLSDVFADFSDAELDTFRTLLTKLEQQN